MGQQDPVNIDSRVERNVDAHKYVVVIASITIGFLNWGMLQSFGTFLPFILEVFSDKRSEASVIHSGLVAVAHIVGVVSGSIVRKWGTGKLVFVGSTLVSLGFISSYFATSIVLLYIFIGLIAGIGMSFTYVCAVIMIGNTFSDRSQTALLSLQNVGTSLGGIILPYLLDWCIKTYTLRGGFLLVGGLLLNNFACAIVIRCSGHNYSNDEIVKETTSVSKNIQVSPKSLVFVLFLIGVTFAMANSIGTYIMLLDILKYKGLSSAEGLHCLVAANVVGMLVRFLPLATKLFFQDSIMTVLISSLFGLAGVLILMFGQSFPSLIIGTMLMGMCDGGTIASAAPVIFQIVKPTSQAFCYGLILTTIGVIAAGIGPLYGGIYDITQSYSLVLLISSIVYGSCMVIICICAFLYRRLQPDVQDTRL